MKPFQFSLLEMFCLVTVACIMCGYCWGMCLKPAIDSGIFSHQKTYREVQIERYERAQHAKP